MSRRVRLSSTEYAELLESHDWCARNGLTGLQRFYDELLTFHAKRRALPPEAYDDREPEEEATGPR